MFKRFMRFAKAVTWVCCQCHTQNKSADKCVSCGHLKCASCVDR